MADKDLITFKPGDVVGGRYEVLRYVGSGSMGLVYACRHQDLDGMIVALKVLFPEVANDPVASQRFKNEIFASYDVFHKNVVRAYDYIQQGSLVAYTMEFIKGGDLSVIMEQGKVEVDKFLEYAVQISDGVNAIHEAGIIHRDLKPENIMLREDGVIKIADFGIARIADKMTLTDHGGVLGTILYVSPEYILESKVDHRSDIYAMGIIFFEMLTGRQPFESDNAYAIMDMRLKQDPPKPSSFREGLPEGLDSIVLNCMQRDPVKRYQKSSDVADDLRKIINGEKLTKSETRPELTKGTGSFNFNTPAKIDLSNIDVSEPSVGIEVEKEEGAPAISSGSGQGEYVNIAVNVEDGISSINQRLRTGYVDANSVDMIRKEQESSEIKINYPAILEIVFFVAFIAQVGMYIYIKA